MHKYVPNMYRRDVFDIDYDKLKKKKIECLIFDLDNTLLSVGNNKLADGVEELLKKLKKDFDLYIISNSGHKRGIEKTMSSIGVDCLFFALKPTLLSFKKVMKKKNYAKEKMCIVGDQIMTDVLGGNRMGIFTILVEPLSSKDLKITSINRMLEKKKMAKLNKMGLFRKGEFYE